MFVVLKIKFIKVSSTFLDVYIIWQTWPNWGPRAAEIFICCNLAREQKSLATPFIRSQTHDVSFDLQSAWWFFVRFLRTWQTHPSWRFASSRISNRRSSSVGIFLPGSFWRSGRKTTNNLFFTFKEEIKTFFIGPCRLSFRHSRLGVSVHRTYQPGDFRLV